MEELEREKWIDVSKGILIILVVIGHSIPGPYSDLNNIIDYIYLFNMPAFFIISGYLYKDKDEPIGKLILRKIKRLLIPYISYLLIINVPIIITSYIKTKDVNNLINNIKHMFLGGQYLNQYSGVLWFLTCLFFTEIFFIISSKFYKKTCIRIICIILFYTLAHIEAWFFRGERLPLALDISLITIMYFSIGFYLRKMLVQRKMFFIAIFISLTSLMLIKNGNITYGLELWGHSYTNYILDFIIPTSMSIVVFNISKHLENNKLLQELGKNSIVIMCLHISINGILSKVFNDYGVILFTIIGIIIPYNLSKYIFNKNKLLKKLFIGL